MDIGLLSCLPLYRASAHDFRYSGSVHALENRAAKNKQAAVPPRNSDIYSILARKVQSDEGKISANGAYASFKALYAQQTQSIAKCYFLVGMFHTKQNIF